VGRGPRAGGRARDPLAVSASAAWFAAVVVALWPAWAWSVARFRDGSDEPWGLVAILALAALVVRERATLAPEPRPAWLLAAAALVLAAVASAAVLPPLARGVLASFAVVAMLAALRTDRRLLLPQLALALLSLPILSSLQFYLGYPLRVVTAEASAWLLTAAGFEAARTGSALTVDGSLVIVDAPCAGIHMAWAAWFTASVAGAWLRVAPAAFVSQMSRVGGVVIGVNVLRNTVLVALESRPAGLGDTWHEATGLLAFALVCLATIKLMSRGAIRARGAAA